MKLPIRAALAALTVAAVTLFGVPATALAAVASPVPTATTFSIPVAAKTYTLTSFQGPRCMPLPGGQVSHSGVDLAATGGTAINAIAAGVVTETKDGTDTVNGRITVQHLVDGETYYSKYLHVWKADTHVKVGQTVQAGQRIGSVGTSGSSTGNHLHLELWRGKTIIDADQFLRARGVDLTSAAKSVSAERAPATCTYYTTGVVNLRQGPSTSTPILTVMAKDTLVTAPPGQSTSDFLPVQVGGRSGWVANWLLTPKKPANAAPAPAPAIVAPAPAPAPAPKPPVVQLTSVDHAATVAVHLREGASTSTRSLLVIPAGANIGKIGVTGTWRQATYNGRTGFVHEAYVKATQSATPPPPVVQLTGVDHAATVAVHLREGASTSTRSLLVIPAGANIGKIGVTGTWRQATYNGRTGFIHEAYVKVAQHAAPKAVTYRTTAALNLRASASTSGAWLTTIPNNATLAAPSAKNGVWWKVSYGSRTGWVHSSYLAQR